MIPKIIWQTHNYKYEDLPSHLSKCTKTWQNLNPGWRYIYQDDSQREDFIKKEIPQLYEKYLKLEPMYQADLWRYTVVYKYGGVYADMDSVCFKPLDYMLRNYSGEDVICVRPFDKDGGINNAHFAAVKKSENLKKVLEYILDQEDRRFVQGLVWEAFSSTMKAKSHKMWFTSEIHSSDYKHYFKDYGINYYGQDMQYSEYLRDILKFKESKIQTFL